MGTVAPPSIRAPGYRVRADPEADPTTTYHPALDGIRALAVAAVLLYHLDLGWGGGGFLGVEVFFVLSGFLITGLLLGDVRRHGTLDLLGFYRRRARRLLPALFLLLAAIIAFTALALPAELGRLRPDVGAALVYVTNWYAIANQQSYFAALGRPSLLQHLWSLAIEEQYYVLWPVALLLLTRLTRGRTSRLFWIVVAGALASTLWMWLLHVPLDDPSRVYYGTDTRAASLLVGSALAIAWPAVAARGRDDRRASLVADGLALAAVLALAWLVATADPYGDFLYRGGFALVSVVTAVLIAAVVHPASALGARALGQRILVWLGLRSYAIYLWHWPIFMVTRPQLDVPIGGAVDAVVRVGLTLLAADLSFRYVENPIRHGSLGRLVARLRQPGLIGREARRGGITVAAPLTAVVAILALTLVGAPASTGIAGLPSGVNAAPPTEAPSDDPSPVPGEVPSTTAPPSGSPRGWSLPARLLLVGDSQANLLALNAPSSVARSFAITDGWKEGCGILSDVIVSRNGFRRNMAECSTWLDRWRSQLTKSHAAITLVMLGAWDVFDLQVDGRAVKFGSADWDAHWLDELRRGISTFRDGGSQVALFGIPCYRPVAGGGTPTLPERGDDDRTGHLNDLLRQAASEDPANVFYVAAPHEFCDDESIATDLYYRWDGVHYGSKGSALVFKTITKPLLAIPQP
jgi:peptidoglycan/LPS O-acetylase OafA/YrhL